MACTCVKTEVGQGSGSVKGYMVGTLCSECQARQDAENILREEQDLIRKAEAEKEALISSKSREIAVEELKAEGTLDKDGNISKVNS